MFARSGAHDGGEASMAAGACPRCGAPLQPLAALERQLDRLVEDGDRARFALGVADRSVPSCVPAALSRLAGLGPDLVQALRCHAGTCDPGAEGWLHGLRNPREPVP